MNFFIDIINYIMLIIIIIRVFIKIFKQVTAIAEKPAAYYLSEYGKKSVNKIK